MNRDDFLDVAARIGRRLIDGATWDGPVCTWEVQAADRADPRRSVARPALGTLYQGTAGIAFFLAELARITGDADAARAAEGGLRHAIAEGDALPADSFGFHTGRVGIAWVATRMARALDRLEFLDDARRLLEPLAGHESEDSGLDVIAGAAGAVPALLEMASLHSALVESARQLGEHLLQRAHREPDGWSWPMMRDTVIRNLTGLAHGASGAGLALLELACATGEERFRFAAEMAFLYERQFFDPASSNWPDWRNSELGNFLFYEGRRDDLLRHARAGTLPPNRPHFMAAWCHGSPGIGLARLRAFERTSQVIYRQEAEAAVASTLASLAPEAVEHEGFSLCHGVAGNCELPLRAAETLGVPAWRERVVEIAAYARERYEDGPEPWPCGTVASVTDPSLMLGEAGIGFFYLRLAEPDLPSPLLPGPSTSAPRPPEAAEDFADLARESADEFFATSRRSIERLLSESAWSPPTGDGPPLTESPAATLHAALRRRIDREHADEERYEMLEDALRLDHERFTATRALDDYTAEFVHGLTHPAWDEIDPESTRFVRARESRLVATDHDWEDWLVGGAGDGEFGGPPEEDEIDFLLYRQGHRFHAQRLGPFAAILLATLDEPTAFDELVERVAEELEGPAARGPLAAKIRPQLESLYRAGFIVPATGRTAFEID